MNWSHVRRTNARRSAEKAKREQRAAAHTAAIDALGGDFTIAELRAAEVKVVDLPHPVRGFDPHVVWVLRGREWMTHVSTGDELTGLMLATDLRNWENCRPVKAPGFKSVAAREYVRARTGDVWVAYESKG